MAVWTEVVRRREPDVRMGVFLDDRIVWTRAAGPGGSQVIKRALAVGRGLDSDFGLSEHPDKRQLFGNREQGVEELKGIMWGNGSVGTNFKMLGLNYECTKRDRCRRKTAAGKRPRGDVGGLGWQRLGRRRGRSW